MCLYNEHLCCSYVTLLPLTAHLSLLRLRLRKEICFFHLFIYLFISEGLLNASRQLSWWVVSKKNKTLYAQTHTSHSRKTHSVGKIVLLISGISHRSKGSIKKWCCCAQAAGLICITTHAQRGQGGKRLDKTEGLHNMVFTL